MVIEIFFIEFLVKLHIKFFVKLLINLFGELGLPTSLFSLLVHLRLVSLHVLLCFPFVMFPDQPAGGSKSQ